MKNARIRLCNLVIYCDASLYVARTHLENHVTLRKHHRLALLLKKIIPLVNGHDKSTLSYKKELPNMRVVAKVRKSAIVYVPV